MYDKCEAIIQPPITAQDRWSPQTRLLHKCMNTLLKFDQSFICIFADFETVK